MWLPNRAGTTNAKALARIMSADGAIAALDGSVTDCGGPAFWGGEPDAQATEHATKIENAVLMAVRLPRNARKPRCVGATLVRPGS